MSDKRFTCDVLHCTMSEKTCGKRWLKAEEIDTSKKKMSFQKQVYIVCKGCPIGEKNSSSVSKEYEASFDVRSRGRARPMSWKS